MVKKEVLLFWAYPPVPALVCITREADMLLLVSVIEIEKLWRVAVAVSADEKKMNKKNSNANKEISDETKKKAAAIPW